MKRIIFRLFRLPTPQEHAERLFHTHQRELIEARRAAQHALSLVTYHERVIADLRRTMAEPQ